MSLHKPINFFFDFLSILTFYQKKTILMKFLDFLKSSGPKWSPCTKNCFDLCIHVLAPDPFAIKWCGR